MLPPLGREPLLDAIDGLMATLPFEATLFYVEKYLWHP